MLISGAAGIGKSRIVAALQERLEPERPIRMRYFCSPHRGDSALFPIIAWLERAAGFTRDDSPAVKLDKLSALLCQSGDTDQETEAVIADLLSLPAGERYPPLPDDPHRSVSGSWWRSSDSWNVWRSVALCCSFSRMRTGAIRPHSNCWSG